jgi:hypothetical protein
MNSKGCVTCGAEKDSIKFKGRKCYPCYLQHEYTLRKSRPKSDDYLEKKRMHASNWQRNNKEKVARIAREVNYKKKYGITIEQYEKMLAKQNNVCAICDKPCSTGRFLAVDHDHTTGAVRALLCQNCNVAIGFLGEDTDRMAKAIEYLQFYSERIS